MKRYKFFSQSIVVLIVLFLCSCKKYLDEKPSSSITVPTTVEDLQGLLDDAALVMNTNVTPGFGEASSDNYFLLQGTYEQRPYREQQLYIWKPADYFFPNGWSKGYAPVYNANYCLEMIEKIDLNIQNETAWKNVKGSALFYRAYNFLNLTWTYAKAYDESASSTDLGISLRLGADFNEPSVRASVSDCYNRIISDAKESLSYLPDIPLHQYRPSKAAAYGLLARTYLSMRKYDSAGKYADLCLSIESDLINYDSEIDPNSNRPFSPFNTETIFYTDMDLSIGTIGRGLIDTTLLASYSSDDIRKSAFFRPSNGYHAFKGTYGNGLFTGIAVDEMYLTRAECYIRTGNKPAAIQDLDTLLISRYKTGTFTPTNTATNDELLDKILNERRKELVYRGLRWMDIKRLNKEGRNIIITRFINGETYTLLPNTSYYALPLPTDIINLTGMIQN